MKLRHAVVGAVTVTIIGIAGLSAATSVTLPMAEISKAYLRNMVTVQGTVTAYTPPSSERAPHSFILRDQTGTLRITCWKDVWEMIPFRDSIQPGKQLTIQVRVSDFKGNLEGQIRSASEIVEGMAGAPLAVPVSPATAAAAVPSVSVGAQPMSRGATEPIVWRENLAAAQTEANGAGRQILVFFCDPGAADCQRMETQILGAASIRSIIQSKYVPVRINMKTNQEMANRLGVFKPCVLVVYSAAGQAVKQLPEVSTAEQMQRELSF